MKIKSEIKKAINFFGKGNIFDKIYTFNFPHAKYTWEEKRALLWLLKTKVFESPEKVYTMWLGSYWGDDTWGILQEYHHPEDDFGVIEEYSSDILDLDDPVARQYAEDLFWRTKSDHWSQIKGGLRAVYVENHLNGVKCFERRPTNFELLVLPGKALPYTYKLKKTEREYNFSLDNSSYMNMASRVDVLLDDNQIGFIDSTGVQFYEDGEDMIEEDKATIQEVWKGLDKDELKSFHEQLKKFLGDTYKITYQYGFDFYSIEDLL